MSSAPHRVRIIDINVHLHISSHWQGLDEQSNMRVIQARGGMEDSVVVTVVNATFCEADPHGTF